MKVLFVLVLANVVDFSKGEHDYGGPLRFYPPTVREGESASWHTS